MSAPATYAWFASHELRLAWRDWAGMLTGGRRGRVGTVAIGLAIFVVFMHALAFVAVKRFGLDQLTPDKGTLAILSAFLLLAWCLMISQAMESVTRAFYSRADLDLILSSPVRANRLFAVRIATLAISAMSMAVLLAGPFANMLAVLGGPRWLIGYGVFVAMGAAAAALAVAFTIFLFRTIGPKRTRFVAQVTAAVVGAGFVIGLQAIGILTYGTYSRTLVIFSDAFVSLAPGAASPFYLPARAVLGDASAFAAVLLCGAAALASAIVFFASRFGAFALAAAGAAPARRSRLPRSETFRAASPGRALLRKEWMLLWRDPWLMSQSLMQILYLGPPALFLWTSFGASGGIDLLLVPVLVMAAGQLAGGLAWLAISGEDAPELVATAPVPRGVIVRAKIEAVLIAVALIFGPILLLFAYAAPEAALVTAWFASLAAASATAIQYWFRAQARRSQFRRRHTSSRVATFAEAFSSIGWAATAALAAYGSYVALTVALLTLGVLGVARAISPHRKTV